MQIDLSEQIAIVAIQAHKECQTVLMWACLAALAVLIAVAAFRAFAPVWDEIWHKWLRLDGLGKCVTAICVISVTLYGGSKGIWSRVQNDGGDSGLSFIGLYTATSNDVQIVDGQTVTNKIPLVALMTLNTPAPQATEVSVRMSDTNQWTTLTKISPWYETEGTTNILAFATAEDYSGFKYWWAGSNKPAVVITSDDIKVTSFTATSQAVSIGWSCEQPLATIFEVKWKEATNSVWKTAATVTNAYQATIGGFWIGRTIDWRITSEYLEDGE